MKSLTKLKIGAAIVLFLTLCAIVSLWLAFDFSLIYVIAVYFILSVTIIVILYITSGHIEDTTKDIENKLNSSIKDALREGEIGIVIYDDDFMIKWMSTIFAERSIDHQGEKILGWLPELQELLNEDVQEVIVVINEEKYKVKKIDNQKVLFFIDISKEYDLDKRIKEEAYVLGLINFDNYEEVADTEDDISIINNVIKVPVLEYLKNNGIVYKTLRNNRIQLILNEDVYAKLYKDRFSILNTIRRESKKNNLDITLSMSFARGSSDLNELDTVASECLDLAQTRGGDQVVVRVIGKEAEFFGGSTEAREKQNKVKVRVMANSLKKLIQESKNVIIVCHQYADADCVGAAIGVEAICNALSTEVCVVLKTGGIESMINEVLHNYKPLMEAKHEFVTEQEALNRLRDDTLVVMVDHHSLEQTNSPLVIKDAKKIAVIDHHRRKADLKYIPTFVYIEASASSTSELVVEFLPYLTRKVKLTEQEANILYLGIVIDTNHFRNRTGVRTFDAAKILRQYGADPVACEQMSQEPYENVMKRNNIINNVRQYSSGVAISCNSGIYTRAIASQASDDLLAVKEIDAAFVIFYVNENEAAISARSNGNINVQVILEKMNGGGHMTAAGLQRTGSKVEDLEKELVEVLDEYFKEEETDESDNA